jgi:hypothetical protein
MSFDFDSTNHSQLSPPAHCRPQYKPNRASERELIGSMVNNYGKAHRQITIV